MNNFEENIKHVQQFVNYCIGKGYSSYSDSFFIKQEYLTQEQTKASAEKEVNNISDELMILIRKNPTLSSLSKFIETSDFLWESSFIETLSAHEKKKYLSFDISLLNMDASLQTQFDTELPYLSAIINYGVLVRYINYLKSFVDKIKEATETVEEKPKNTKTPEKWSNFESNFEDWQLKILTQCINEVKIFNQPITIGTMKDILLCKLKEPLNVARNKNKLLAYFFSALDDRSLITREWQVVCAKNELFLSSGKGIIMQQNHFSSAVAQNKEFTPKDCNIIDNYIKQLKRH